MNTHISFLIFALALINSVSGFCADFDRDRLPDDKEIEIGTDPKNPDTDGDGLADGVEVKSNYKEHPTRLLTAYTNPWITDPLNPDTDGDGLSDGWEAGAGRYTYVVEKFTWEEARIDSIRNPKSHLATITSKFEQGIVENVMQVARQVYSLDTSSPSNAAFLGADDKQKEGQWQWITGEDWEFSLWANGEPNNREEEDFLIIDFRTNYYWNDAKNDFTEYSFIEPSSEQSWGKRSYILEIGYPSDPTKADSDEDGYNDFEEYENNTDPNDPDSLPELIKVFTSIELNFGTKAGNMYQLQYSNNLEKWIDYQNQFEGTGNKSAVFVSIKNTKMNYFRLLRVD